METRNQDLSDQLSHRSQRCDLYKRELNISLENHQGKLEEFRNGIFENFIAKYNVPRAAFPDLDKPTRAIIPSLDIQDSDLEDDSTDEDI